MAAGGTAGGAPRRRPVKAVPDKPDLPRVAFDMDAAEREDAQGAPFPVRIDGVVYVLGDVLELSADELVPALSDSLLFMERVAPVEGRETFLAAVRKQPAWKVRDVAMAYYQHYGLGAEGEDGALPA